MNIYVGNLSHETSEADLKQAFEAFGEVISAKIISDRSSGESRGFGFVEMPSESEAQKAIAGLNGEELKGQPLTVNEARPQRERPRNPGSWSYSEPGNAMTAQVYVDNDVERALRTLKKNLSKDGDHRRLRERKHFTPRSERRRKKAIRAKQKRRK